MISYSGSVLTSVAVPIARDHKMFLIDQTGTGANFFTADNPYIALIADPVSSIWPKPLADFLTQDGPPLGIKASPCSTPPTILPARRRARCVSSSRSRIPAWKSFSTRASRPKPRTTPCCSTISRRKSRRRPPPGLRAERHRLPAQRPGQRRQVQAPVLRLPGYRKELLEKNLGSKALNYVFTYVPSSQIAYETNFGMSLKEYSAEWHKKYANAQVEFGFNSVAGYTTGLVLEKTLATATSLEQLELRRAMFSLSGNLKTLDGTFELDPTGAQIGEITPLGQLVVDDHDHLKIVTVWPHAVATGKPIYPRP